MLNLQRISVTGFRGFSHEQSFEFNAPLTFLFGENGTGKSSLLNALEWALFGKECIGAATGIRERVGWEVANRHLCPPHVQVKVEFSEGTKPYTVVRALAPMAGSRLREQLELQLPDGTELQGTEAEQRLARDLSCAFRDFLTTVYQHQEAIRAVLTQEARDRNDALDRLLGLSHYRNILTGIEEARIAREFRRVVDLKGQIAREVETALKLRERDRRELEEEAKGAGLEPADLTEERGLDHASRLWQAISRFFKDSGFEGLEFSAPLSAEELEHFCHEIHRKLRETPGKIPDLHQQEELLNRRATIARLQQDLRDLNADREECEARLQEYQRAHGSRADLENRLSELGSEEAKRQEQIRAINAKAPLLREAISFLETLTPQVVSGRCPLCGKEAPNLLEELRLELASLVQSQLQSLQTSLENVRAEKRKQEATLLAWQETESHRAELERRSADFRELVSTALKISVQPQTDVGQLLAAELNAVQERLDTIEKSVHDKLQQIEGLEERLGQVRLIVEYLKLSQKIERLGAILDSDEFKQLEVNFEQVAEFLADLDAIKTAITEAAHEEARTKVLSASALIDQFFRRTADHPGLKRVVLEVTSDRRTGRNSYTLTDETGQDLLPILSQGDMNCLALSIFLGLASAARQNSSFGFLLLDDPSQSLGSEEKRSLIALLREMYRHKRVIVATMDSELRDILLEECPSADIMVYHFTAWTPEDGPRVEKAIPM